MSALESRTLPHGGTNFLDIKLILMYICLTIQSNYIFTCYFPHDPASCSHNWYLVIFYSHLKRFLKSTFALVHLQGNYPAHTKSGLLDPTSADTGTALLGKHSSTLCLPDDSTIKPTGDKPRVN